MKKSLIALALVSAFAAPAMAEETPVHSFTANVGVVSDYVFRGISQSQHHPALQGGVDYAHQSGLYAGFWASTVNWTDRTDVTIQKNNHIETDWYGGFKNTIGDFGYDVGVIRYYYPGSFNPNQIDGLTTANTTEVYIGGSWKFISLKYSQAVSNNFMGFGAADATTRSKGSNYTDLTVTYPVDETLNVIAHIGRQNIENTVATGLPASYTDWKLGVTKDFGFGVLGVAYTDTNAKGNFNEAGNAEAYRWNGKDVSKGVLAVSFTKTF